MDPQSKPDYSSLAQSLREIVGADAVITEVEAKKPFECDGLTAYRELPLMVVLPLTVEEVQQVVKVCAQHSVPVVTRGAGTGLSRRGIATCRWRFAEFDTHESDTGDQ